jgi:hypothetical protein
MKKLILTLLILTSLNLFAHPGGHYKTNDLPNLHHWSAIADGKLVVGNFMMSKNDVIFVEGIKGQIWQVNYQSIAGADKIYVDQEINKINTFNGFTSPSKIGVVFDYKPFLLFILCAIISIFFLVVGIRIRKNQANPFARYSVSFLAVLFFALSLFACKKSNLDAGPSATSPCGVATGLTASVSSDSLLLNWNPVTGASSYIINYKKQTETIWKDTTSTANLILLTRLTTGVNYELQVQTVCANGNNSMSGTIIVSIPDAGNGGNVDPNFIPRNITSFMDSTYSLYKPPYGTVATSWDSVYFHISSLGMPTHNSTVPLHDKMIGITSWQQQVPIPQFYTDTNSWSIPLQPVYATTPMSTRTNFMKGAVAIALNGIAIFNALNNRGEDSYTIGELDNWGGHCGRADDYHYHAAPLHLAGPNGRLPIAYALDGFAVYGTNEPDGIPMQSLDTCHGHKIANQVYHYHGTSTYPYVIGAMRGKVTLDPTTPAPENQILPQAFAKGVRPALTPLNGAVITDFVAQTPSHYLLTYRRGTKYGYVEYYWTGNGGVGTTYTYILTDTSGVATTSTYTRR